MKLALSFLVLLSLGVADIRGASAPNPEAINESAIKMSLFEVQANSVDFKRWIKVGSPNFILYTDASEREASTTLRELELLRLAGQAFFGRRALKLSPVTVILPTSGSDWRKLEAKGSVEWKAAVSMEADDVSEVIVVQYDWQDRGTSIVHAAEASAEATRLRLDGPFWFHRGLHSLFETVEFDNNKVILGRSNPRTWSLQSGQQWLPWGRFFEVDENSPEFVKEKFISVYEGQLTVFSHFLFTNPDRVWISRLSLWLAYLNAGHPPSEAEFKTIFTQDWKTWQRTMESYLDGGRYKIYTINLPPETTRFTQTAFKLSVTEMRELFVLAQILVQSVPASEASLDTLLARGLKTESLREMLAAACIQKKRRAAALDNLRQLIASGSVNPRVYISAASLLTDAHMPKLTLDARLGTEAIEAREYCRRAIELEPQFREANLMLAWIEALGPEIGQPSIASIEEIYTRARGRIPTDDIIMALAVALWRGGDIDTARELGANLKSDALATKHSRELASQLLDRLKATPGRELSSGAGRPGG
jgi:hypothetical protein